MKSRVLCGFLTILLYPYSTQELRFLFQSTSLPIGHQTYLLTVLACRPLVYNKKQPKAMPLYSWPKQERESENKNPCFPPREYQNVCRIIPKVISHLLNF